jgi:trans-2,3-dihydro-3-hydroxyanthranilate isomerase
MLAFLLANDIHKSKTPYGTTVGVFCYCLEAQNPENDMHSRMFLLQDNTVLEDPATGSAHTAFALYAHEHGIFGDAFQKRSEQGFEIGRPSILHIGSATDGTVSLGGKVQFVARWVWRCRLRCFVLFFICTFHIKHIKTLVSFFLAKVVT